GVNKPSHGEIYFEGKPVSTMGSRAKRLAYSSDVAMVFQDPYSSMNPVYRITHPIERGIVLHRRDVARRAREGAVERSLGEVGLVPPGGEGGEVPAGAEGRPASGGGLRGGARGEAEADRRRRAGLDAGRVDPDRGAEPDERAARARGSVIPLHHARRRERALHRRPRARALRRPPRRGRADRGGDRAAEAPVHAAAPFGRPGSARAFGALRRGRCRGAAEGDRSEGGLPVPQPLPAGDRYV